jgi:hypothetical protein
MKIRKYVNRITTTSGKKKDERTKGTGTINPGYTYRML